MSRNSDPPGKNAVDEDVVRALARLLDETKLTEIEIERDGFRVRVAPRGGSVPCLSRRRGATAAADGGPRRRA